jgi:hypothetical protein
MESTPDGLDARVPGGSSWADVVRWVLLLPITAGAATFGIFALSGIRSVVTIDTGASELAGLTLEALGYGLAVYLAGKIAPRGGKWVAIVVASVFIAIEFRHALRPSVSPPYYEVVSTLLACSTSAWLFWKHGRSGFRRPWRWIAIVVLTVPVAVFVGIRLSRWTPAGRSVSRYSKQFHGDGISFRYPPEWDLTVGEWTNQTGSPSIRELDLNHLGEEGLTIYLIRPPVGGDSIDFHRKFRLPGATPVSPVSETAAVVGGERIVGTRRDYSMTSRGVQVTERVEIFTLGGKDQTIRVLTMADREEWPAVERRFHLFFSHLTFD